MNRLALLLAGAALTLAAAEPYQRLVSEHFEILAPRDPEAAAVLRQLEFARAFFAQSAQLHSPHARSPLVFVPATSTQFARMRGPGLAYGFYVPLPGRDAIVLQGLEATFRRAVIHEYTHLAVQYSGGRYPRWLNEGIAEYYSTLRAVGDRAEYGHVLPERVARLRESPWFEIEQLVTRGSQRRATTALSEDVFYAQSWLLVHMLMSAERYREGWPVFRDAISIKGQSEAEAFEGVYRRDLEQVRDDLRAYFAAGKFEEQSTAMARRPAVKVASYEAGGFDIEATTAGVEGWAGRKAEAQRAYQKLARASEDACKWQRELGDAAESAGLFEDALHHRRKDLDCRKDPVAACDFARGVGLHPSPAAELMALAAERLRGTESCGYGFYWLGLRAYRNGRFPEAAALLEQARGLPETAAVEVDRLTQDALRRGSARSGPTPRDTNVEVLQADDKPPLSRVEGVLEQAVCAGQIARINVRGKVAIYTFYVEDRAKFADLACGAQKRAVSVGFEQVTLPRVGAVAAVRELQFR